MNKTTITSIAFIATLFITLVSCSDEVLVNLQIPEAEKYIAIYMPQSVNSPINLGISITDSDYELAYSAHLGGALKAKSTITVGFTVSPDLVESYNQKNNTSYQIMPEGSYVLQAPTAAIPAGAQTTGILKLIIKTKGFLDPFKTYMLPVKLHADDDNLLNKDLSVTHFLITGAYAPGEVPREKVLSMGADAGSFIIDFNGDFMRMDPNNGDLVFYKADPSTGLFTAPPKTISQGWDAFDKIVFFAENRLIGRFKTGGQNINQYVIDSDGNFISQREVGQGWGVLADIVPYKGLLLGISPNGDMTQYPLNEMGDFDYGNIRQIGSGWSGFKQIFEYQNSLIAIENNGDMWQYPISETGVFGTRSRIGTGWDMYTRIIIAGTDLLALDSSGDLWRYKFNPKGLWPLKAE